jgi:hypothetical protein
LSATGFCNAHGARVFISREDLVADLTEGADAKPKAKPATERKAAR